MFGVVLACLTLWLRYTYFNGHNPWIDCSRKLLDMVRPKITSLRCLFCLWCLPTFKYAFDLDLLRYLHQFGNTDYAARKLQHPYKINFDYSEDHQPPHDISLLAELLQNVVLFLMMIYLFALLFDFEDLFDFSVVNKDDLPVKLSDREIDEIGKKVKIKMNMTDQLTLTLK